MLRLWGFHGESTAQVIFIGYPAKSDSFGVFLNHLPRSENCFLMGIIHLVEIRRNLIKLLKDLVLNTIFKKWPRTYAPSAINTLQLDK